MDRKQFLEIATKASDDIKKKVSAGWPENYTEKRREQQKLEKEEKSKKDDDYERE
ncbi:MAG: hypothetical protein J6M60_00835 [Clostridia bacterium]|nr:hypothetical protein [Clostridia bacterium]